MQVDDLTSEEYSEFYQGYINNIPEGQSLGMLFKSNIQDLKTITNSISHENLSYRYAEGKWSVAEILQHLIDVERIFQYRALCIARDDKTSLPGFDHDEYVIQSEAGARSLKSLTEEAEIVRNSGIALFSTFSEVVLKRKGVMSNAPASVRAIGFIIVGHTRHHINILQEKYL
ncbi:DinB family protein [Salegentibacter sp. F188]|uniref:DinB family protein n=1 Tax=Autumnicola patrickiae TaxID=3075591 RepID=A0ABU3E3X3_9FLAO|nr:DinB family protein [Salegentibacter sp. F188]MDT0690598.1 DinB family protein [Salegentibacter sp. F188]